MITSLENEKVKNWIKLQNKKYRDLEGKFLIEGDHLVNIALEKGLILELICVDDSYDFKNKFLVSQEVMNKISKQVNGTNVIGVCQIDYREFVIGNAVLIDALQDPGNLGTIIRSAVGFGFKTIILGDNTVDLYNDKTIRASEGMLFEINFVRENLFKTIDKLKEHNYIIVGTNVKTGADIRGIKGNVGLIIGNEGAGMQTKLEDVCDKLVKIPMTNNCESLNAGVAASILMYEVYHG